MEVEDVSEEVEWESKRVAVAFGSPEVSISQGSTIEVAGVFKMLLPCPIIVLIGECRIRGNVNLRVTGKSCLSFLYSDQELCIFDDGGDNESRALLLRALFRLGHDSEQINEVLKCSLSAHEKLELRLSMSREFWPQKWIDEELR